VIQSAIALNRFGLGTRPGDHVSGDARRWLTAQFDCFESNPAPWARIPDLATSIVESHDVHAAIEASKNGAEAARVASKRGPTFAKPRMQRRPPVV
jgi:hypothetical protein